MTHLEKIETLFDLIEELEIGMLVTEHNMQLRSRPMKAFADKAAETIWFLTKTESAKILDIAQDQQVNLSFACPKSQNYISISGRAVISRDKRKIDEMWSENMAVWFECDKTDPNVAAICVKPSIAEYWQGESNKLKRMFEITKAKLTDEKPDLGENETVRLAG